MRTASHIICNAYLWLAVCFCLWDLHADDAASPEQIPDAPLQGGENPKRLEFGIWVLDIDEISGQDQNFAANFVAIVRWKDERSKHDGEQAKVVPLKSVWHPQIILTNRQAGVRMPLAEVAEVAPDGTTTFRQQYVGPLSQRLRLHDFPLDSQTFSIHFAIAGIREGDMEIVPGEFSEDLKGGGMAKELSLPDWEVISYEAIVKPYKLTTTLATPGFAFEFVAKRHNTYFIWQAVMPLVLIVMMSWVPFWVDPKKAELQFAISGSTVLTLIAFRITLASLLPPLPYLTRMDILTIGSTIIVFIAFLQVVTTSLLAYADRLPIAQRTDRICTVAFPIAFIALVIWSLVL